MIKGKNKKVQWVAVLLTLVLLVSTIPISVSAETTAGKDKAMWAWFPNQDIKTEDGRKEMVAFAKEKGVNVIYLNIGERDSDPYLEMHPEQYRDFIRLAHANDIKVYALDGAAEWAKQENYKIPISRMLNVFMYNHNSSVEEQFDGIQFDIEPYLLDEWDTDGRSQLIQEYLNGLKVLSDKADAYGKSHDFEFMVAMPFWFDGEEYETTYRSKSKPLSDHVMDIVSNVALMAYRDFAEGRDSITYHTEHEVEYANEIGAKAVIGVETQYLEPYEKVSFFEEGEAYMNKQLQIVDQIYFGQLGYGGQAVHKYQSYQTMKP
ncbi:hypothetical protein GI584_05205 [Gracilibacillus salitolerans]|uniref:Amidase n=1 Tax=Gracilibacillus salitolerans TaxID=2663022 RepID=A0A5Q2TFR0_9BACI|nr:hypothetical protein [Gracilibacillus salitolerans]QGH33455.1 hypothetical protein GI584_05205 [Gracilibacillus salitolerans]